MKTLILTDERTGGTSLLYILNSFTSEKYSGLDDLHTLFNSIKNQDYGWLENIINSNIKDYFSKIENVDSIDYFELLEVLFNNGINTYKLSISSITNNQFTSLLYNLKNSNHDIKIINLVRKNEIERLLSLCYAIQYVNIYNSSQGFDIVDKYSEIEISDETIYYVFNKHKTYFQRLTEIEQLENTVIVFYDFFENPIYAKEIFKILNLDTKKILNPTFFIKTYFKNYLTCNKKISNKEYVLEKLTNLIKTIEDVSTVEPTFIDGIVVPTMEDDANKECVLEKLTNFVNTIEDVSTVEPTFIDGTVVPTMEDDANVIA